MNDDPIDTGTMQLDAEEAAMLRGERGAAMQQAIRFQIEVGRFFEAERFVPITNAHVMGDIEVMGDAGLGLLRKMSSEHARCAVPTSSNARCMHFEDIPGLQADADEVVKEHEVIALLKDMRVAATDTCINYQTVYQPKLGEHVAWGDTGTVIYANSVFGARTNFEGGYSSFAAAVTGRTPAYGFHLDEKRRGTILVKLEAQMRDLADWGALGKIVGHPNQDYFAVPVFDGVARAPLSDALKHLGASLASYGSMAMFHMVGVTPEAQTLDMAFAGVDPQQVMTVTDADIDTVYAAYRIVDGGHSIVVFSGPQLSLFEIQDLARRFEGRRVAAGMQAFLTTNHAVYSDAKRLGYVAQLEAAGVRFLQGVCFYLLQRLTHIREENGWTNLFSNSGKLVNTITAHRFNTVLRRTGDCVEIACTGVAK
jgi:predicted aconitase